MIQTAGVPIQDILFTVFQSIFQVFLLCLAGFVLSFKGIVDKHTSKALNHINIALFTPALLFSKVAYFLSPSKLGQLWVIPIFFTVVTCLSALVARWLAHAFRLKRSQVNFATAAAMFMNSNSLPVALMQSLAATVPILKWGPDDTIDAMFGRSLTYLVVFSTLGMILRWSYGVHLLSQADEPDASDTPTPAIYRDADDASEAPALVRITIDPSSDARLVDYETETNGQNAWHTRALRSRLLPPNKRNAYLHRSRSHLPTSLGDQSESEDTDEIDTTEAESEDTLALPADNGFLTDTEDATSAQAPPASTSSTTHDSNSHDAPRWEQRQRSLLQRLLTSFTSLSPPLVASLFSIVCVLIPPIQHLLQSEEMVSFKGALDNAGGCSIPLTLIVLGGWFWDGETKPKAKTERVDEDAKDNVQVKTKSKGENADERHVHSNGAVRNPSGERPTLDTSFLRAPHLASNSRNSSSGSVSSMIGAFGDVLMARMYSRSGIRRAKGRAIRLPVNEDDVEPGPLATHAEEAAENGIGHAPRSRSRSTAMHPISASASTPASSPTSSPARGTNPPGETLTIVATLLARMIIVPLLVIPMFVLCSRLGWGGEVFEDPVFIVSSMLLVSSPPALTLAQISQRVKTATATGTDADADTYSPFERLFSRTVFWAYCVLTPPVTILSVMLGLVLIGG